MLLQNQTWKSTMPKKKILSNQNRNTNHSEKLNEFKKSVSYILENWDDGMTLPGKNMGVIYYNNPPHDGWQRDQDSFDLEI